MGSLHLSKTSEGKMAFTFKSVQTAVGRNDEIKFVKVTFDLRLLCKFVSQSNKS
jgi:hypothetical protein